MAALTLAACAGGSSPAQGTGGAGGAGGGSAGDGGTNGTSSPSSGPSTSATSPTSTGSGASTVSSAESTSTHSSTGVGAGGATGSGGGGGAGAGGDATGGSAGTGAGGAAAPGLYINEVYVDRDLSGDKVEWIEIAGPPGAPLGGIRLRHYAYKGAGQPTVDKFDIAIAAAGAVMPASGKYTLGGLLSPAMKILSTSSPDSFGFDNTSGSIQLYRESDTALLDALGYGAATPVDAPTAPKTTMFGSPAALPPNGETGQGLSRKSAAPSADNSVDFCVQKTTPNNENAGVCE